TTGWAFLDTAGGTPLGGTFSKWADVEQLILTHEPDQIIIEAFRLYPSASSRLKWNDLIAAQVFGACAAMADKYLIPWHAQNAVEAKRLDLGRGNRFHKHTLDAYKHILVWLKKQGETDAPKEEDRERERPTGTACEPATD
ncbi:MAG: hypothetical protein KKC55_17235, partial [Gammaproteobacteria bacterium]|nr:hypothetical protein [Gammaproteobacteria bacterium]